MDVPNNDMTKLDLEFSDADFEKYCSLDHLKEKLKELRGIDLSNAAQEEITKTFFSYLEILPSLVGKYSIEKFNNFKFYRVRLNIDRNNEDLNLIQTYSYPLPLFCSENGRANLKNRSVFYCSNSALTAILESKPKVGDIGYLSIWEGRTTREMKTGVLLPRNLRSQNEWHALANDIYLYVDNTSNERAKQKALYYQETLKFVADLFLEEKPPYPITSWISNELLYGPAWKDFIVYPSFANDSYSSNLALHPNVVNNYLKFIKLIRFKVLEAGGQKLSLSTGRVGEILNTNVTWRNATKEELDFSLLPS